MGKSESLEKRIYRENKDSPNHEHGSLSSIVQSVICLSRLILVEIELHIRRINIGKKSSSNETQHTKKKDLSQSETYN